MDRQVAVIIPTYNRLETLPRAVASVRSQSYCDWELWIVDDGSTDGTEAWVRAQGQGIQYIKTEQRGVSAARNVAITRSRSPFVAFLDSDDEWLPNKLERQINLALARPELPLIHGEEIWIRNGVRVNPHKKHRKQGGRIFLNCLPLCCISPSTAFLRRSAFEEVGLFREDFPVCEDYELWLRICARYEVGFIDEPLIKKFGGHEDQLSRKYIAMDYWRVKALLPFLFTSVLSPFERRCVAEIIHSKCEILLKGYLRHNNMTHYSEIEEAFMLARQLQQHSASQLTSTLS